MGRLNSGNQVSHKLKSPFKAYNGDKPYIFISYKHNDADLVYPIIKKFHDMGFNIWYDEGLPYGENFDIVIPKKIGDAKLFVNFITRTCMACAYDSNDYMVKESDIAQYLEVPILAIYPEIEEFKLEGYYLTNFLKKQSLYRQDYDDNEDFFIEKCVEVFMSKGLEPDGMKTIESETEDKPQEVASKPEIVDSPINGLPAPLYDGDEPYIYVSYSHKDADRVFPEIKRLNDLGCKVWYDADIGGNLFQEIGQHIKHSFLFVVFVSYNYVSSLSANKELHYAYNKNNILLIGLDEVEYSFPGRIKSISKFILKFLMSEEVYVYKLKEALAHFGFHQDGFLEDDSFPAYSGNEPYIFAAYSHKDADLVLPDLNAFTNLGFNIWYDQGIASGSDWLEEIEKALLNCSLFVVFMSQNAVESSNVTNEVFLALKKDKPVIPIYLERTNLAGGLDLTLSSVRSINKYYLSDEEYLQECIDEFERCGFKS